MIPKNTDKQESSLRLDAAPCSLLFILPVIRWIKRRLTRSNYPNVQARQSDASKDQRYHQIPDATHLPPLIQSMMDEDLHGKWYSPLLQSMMISKTTSEETGVPRVVGIQTLPTGEVRHQIQIPSSKPRHVQRKPDHLESNHDALRGDGILGERCDTSEGPYGGGGFKMLANMLKVEIACLV